MFGQENLLYILNAFSDIDMLDKTCFRTLLYICEKCST